MTWRPVLIIFDLFPNFDMPDMTSFQAWMAVLLARPSLWGKSKHISCQRALGATCPQESVASARVWREQKKFERAASMFVSQASWRCWSWVPSATTWQEPAVWEWLLRSSSGRLLREKRASMSRLVSLWRILFEVPTKDSSGVERVWRFSFFWICLLYVLTLWHARQQD